MKLTKIASKFNTTKAKDAYGIGEFTVQFDPLSYSKIDGVQVRKRSISAAPDVTIPSRGAITIDGQVYLIGHGAPDYWKNSVIRKNYVIQGADGLAGLIPIHEELLSNQRIEAYSAVVFSKYLTDERMDSTYRAQYQIFLAGSESAPAGSLIFVGAKCFLVRESYLSNSGLLIAMANEIDAGSFETINFGSKTYDPVSDTYSGLMASTRIMRVRWTENFEYLSLASEPYVRGDQHIFMLKSVAPKPSDLLTLSDGVWRVLSVTDNGDKWGIHARRN